MDGYGRRRNLFPPGAWRPKDGVQRGSVQGQYRIHGRSAYARELARPRMAKRLPIKDAPTLVKIPVLPISYADAQNRFLRPSPDRPLPKAWVGGFAAHLPHWPRPRKSSPEGFLPIGDLKPIYDVIAKNSRITISGSMGDSRKSS